MLSSWDVIPTRVPISITALILYVLPPMVCYFVVAALAIMPRTGVLRAALWPVTCFLALRATVSVDMSPSQPWRNTINTSLIASISTQTSSIFRLILTRAVLHVLHCYPHLRLGVGKRAPCAIPPSCKWCTINHHGCPGPCRKLAWSWLELVP